MPGTDVAIMIALAYVLATEGLADRDFLATYCTGYPRLERYLLGIDDGVAKSPDGRPASAACPPTDHVTLARRMAAPRTMVTVSWSLQRVQLRRAGAVDGVALAAMLGQIGLPGGGFGHGYGSQNDVGMARCCAAPCRLSPGPQSRRDVHSGGRRQPTCCCTPASSTTTTANA